VCAYATNVLGLDGMNRSMDVRFCAYLAFVLYRPALSSDHDSRDIGRMDMLYYPK
jgi:hypothetical protein